MRKHWRQIKLGLWNLGALMSFVGASVCSHQRNTAESTWWNVLGFGLLMLARTEK